MRAVCSQAGVGFQETSLDEDALAVDGDVQFIKANVRVQIKCTGQYRINGGDTATWQAKPSWWESWHKSLLPVYFVIVMVDPDEQIRWLHHVNDGTIYRAAAFWVRVDDMPEDSGVTVPKQQRLTADTLVEWASDVESILAPRGDAASHGR
jgi:hypothetical protein